MKVKARYIYRRRKKLLMLSPSEKPLKRNQDEISKKQELKKEERLIQILPMSIRTAQSITVTEKNSSGN